MSYVIQFGKQCMKEHVVMIAFSFIIIAESLQWASPWTQESKFSLWIMQSSQILYCKPGVGQNVALPSARIFSRWFQPAFFIHLDCFSLLFRHKVCPGIALDIGLQSLVGHSLIDWWAVWHVRWPKHSRVGGDGKDFGRDGRWCWRFWAHSITAQYNGTVNVENSFFQLCDFPKTQVTSMLLLFFSCCF